MKQLRILTGQHAGVYVKLTSTRYLIGADDVADIQLLDWTFDPMILEVGEDDMISIAATSHQADEPKSGALASFEDFLPKRFGDIVLCVGPTDMPWPSDIDLIERLSQPAVAEPVPAVVERMRASRSLPRRLLPYAIGTVLVTAAFGAAVANLNQSAQEAAQAASLKDGKRIEPLKARVDRVVAEMSLPAIDVAQDADGVTVSGLLDNQTDAQGLRRRLASFAPEHIVHSYASAPDIAQSISESLSQPGIKVTYKGQGAFIVSGQVPNVDRVRETVARVASDLAPLVRHIEVDATELPPSGRSQLSALMNSDDFQYVQTRDGVKHLSLSSELDTGTHQALTAPTR